MRMRIISRNDVTWIPTTTQCNWPGQCVSVFLGEPKVDFPERDVKPLRRESNSESK